MEDKVCCRYCEKLVPIGSKHQCLQMKSQGYPACVADYENKEVFVSEAEAHVTNRLSWSKCLPLDDNDSGDDDACGDD